MKQSEDAPGQATIDQRIARDAGALVQALVAVLEQLPGQPLRPQQLARRLKISQSLASRILAASRAPDPFTAAFQLPGTDGFRTFLQAARRVISGNSHLPALEAAVGQFDAMMRNELGDRATLESVLAPQVPRAREKFELVAKQDAFRGFSKLKGLAASVSVVTQLVQPSDTAPETYDNLTVNGHVGLRRLRPGVPLRTRSFAIEIERPDSPKRMTNLQGVPVTAKGGAVLLDQFCSRPLPELKPSHTGSDGFFEVEDDRIGARSEATFFWATRTGGWTRFRPDGSTRRRTYGAVVDIPARLLLIDNFVHRSMTHGEIPGLTIHDAALGGAISATDPSRDEDLLDLLERVELVPSSQVGIGLEEVPGYAGIVAHAAETIGWNLDDFLCFRCLMRYPVYGSQVAMAFASYPAAGGGARPT